MHVGPAAPNARRCAPALTAAALAAMALSIAALGVEGCAQPMVDEQPTGAAATQALEGADQALEGADQLPEVPGPPTEGGSAASDQATVAEDAASWDRDAPFAEIAPPDYALVSVSDTAPEKVAVIMEGRTIPAGTVVAVFASPVEPTQRITATLLTYKDYAGALAMYNKWFSEYGFIPVAERRQVPLGDQAECFDAGWPPFHAVVLRQGPLFALVQADREVPLDRCAALLEDLLVEATS